MKLKLFQMDVKSTFLNGLLEEKVYVAQPKGFVDPKFFDHVFCLKKAPYGLKQALRAWYEWLTQFFIDHGFHRRSVDKTFFVQKIENSILIAQIYVDDIVFGSSYGKLATKYANLM